VPAQALGANETYKIIITRDVSDEAGTPLAAQKEVQFKTGT
jgi:hypothetical protein